MGTGRYPDGASEAAEEQTVSDEEWPVAEHYRVEAPATPAEEDATVVVSPDVTAEPRPARRFPPELGRGALTAGLVVLLLLLLIPAGVWLATRSDDDPSAAAGTGGGPTVPPPTTESETTTATPPPSPAGRQIPNATGQSLPQARDLLETAGFRVRFERVASDRPRDEVVRQAPEAGGRAERGSIVVLTVSEGAPRIAVPDVEGLSADDARERLRELGLDARTRPVPSDERAGTVVEQAPAAGAEVAEGAVVALGISEARETPPPPTVRVPDVVGARSSDARSRLRAAGLGVTQRPVESDLPAGEVVSQSPRAGAQLREGGTVTLRVSTGPPGVEVPDVAGLDEASASRELEEAGFTVRVVDEPTTEPAEDGVVVAQSPAAGTTRREGGTVTITVARLS